MQEPRNPVDLNGAAFVFQCPKQIVTCQGAALHFLLSWR